MKRVVKQPEVRKNEIIDIARALFNEKGYDQTSVNEIIEKAGIAKGTFYYYYGSKEEVLDEIVRKSVSDSIRSSLSVVSNKSLNAPEKIKKMIRIQNNEIINNHKTIQQLHNIRNTDMHQKMIIESILQFAPVMAEVVEQGIGEGFFKTGYPLETMEFILTGSQFLFDPGIFQWTAGQYKKRIKAMAWILEKSLCAEEGSFDYLYELFENTEKTDEIIEKK